MKKINKRIIIFLFCILIIILLYCILSKTNLINNIRRVIDRNKPIVEDELSYIIYDNISDSLKVMVTIQRKNGIDKVAYLGSDNNIIELNCNKKEKVAIDIKAKTNIDYEFKITSDGKETIEKINIPEDYIDKYIKFIKDEETSTEEKYAYTIEYHTDLEEDVKYYYKIGKNTTTWNEYNGKIDLTLSSLDDFEGGTTTLCAKEVDPVGNTLIKETKYNVPPIANFDIFGNTYVQNKTMEDYGFTSSFSSCEHKSCSPYYLYAGHEAGYGSYSSSFNLDWDTSNLNYFKPQELYINFVFYANNYYNNKVAGSATLYYKDGTNTSQSIPLSAYTSWTNKPLTFSIDKDKEISYLKIQIWGRDETYSSSKGYVNSLMLKRNKFK